MTIGGIGFRFIDTAGIRETVDVIEGLGIKKTFEKIGQAQVVMYLFDSPSALRTYPPKDNPSVLRTSPSKGEKLRNVIVEIEKIKNQFPLKPLVIIANKVDQLEESEIEQLKTAIPDLHLLSAKKNIGVDALKAKMLDFVNTGALRNDETIVTNSRHYDALLKALEEIEKVQYGINTDLPSDLMAIDIKQALYHFGEITGQVTNDELLGNIFANFCIGK